jgi:ATP-dependent RNA helicase RhlE
VNSVSFSSLGIAEPLLRALTAEAYTTPTPIQTKAIPLLLEGRDLLGLAQTGTGKTAAFGLPLLQKLAANRTRLEHRSARALILAPTRELALQIHDSLKTYGRHLGLKHAVILGGVKQGSQVKALANGVDVLVATPGRLLDLVSQKHLRLDRVTTLVVDEADRMFDMGFVRDLRKIVALLPRDRQSMLFSATMPDAVASLTGEILRNPVRVEAAPPSKPAEGITQLVYHVDAKEKRGMLQNLLRDPALARVIVFARTKHSANRIAEHLTKAGTDAEAIHGNKSQNARIRALERFRSGEARVLVATDIAARGIDVDGITHVINFELPNIADSYVHRIGRTARAGASGTAISLCDPSERGHLREIERQTRIRLTVANDPRQARRAA